MSKKEEHDAPEKAPSNKKLLVYNNGLRTITLKNGPDGQRRILPPGASIEAIDQQEYDHLMRYKDISDAVRMIPNVQEIIDKLTAEKAALQAELDEYRKKDKSKDKDK